MIEGPHGTVASVSDLLLVDSCQAWVWTPAKAPIISLSKKSNKFLSTDWFQEWIWVWFT